MRVKAPAQTADDIVVTDQADTRCPHCGALLRAGAQWCTLCYTDLRPKPAPEPVAVSAREPSYAAGVTPGGSLDPLIAPEPTVGAADTSIALGGWPCTGCEALVSFEDDVCPTCGTRFLEGARGEPDLLDRIGRGGLPVSTQTLIIAGGAALMIAIIVAAMYLIGMIF